MRRRRVTSTVMFVDGRGRTAHQGRSGRSLGLAWFGTRGAGLADVVTLLPLLSARRACRRQIGPRTVAWWRSSVCQTDVRILKPNPCGVHGTFAGPVVQRTSQVPEFPAGSSFPGQLVNPRGSQTDWFQPSCVNDYLTGHEHRQGASFTATLPAGSFGRGSTSLL
jgi:hypothetical protein